MIKERISSTKKKYFVFAKNNHAFSDFKNRCPLQTKAEFNFIYVNSIDVLRGIIINPEDAVEFLPSYRIREKLSENEIKAILESRRLKILD